MRKKTWSERFEAWAEPRYGRALTREERAERNKDVPRPTLREAFNGKCGPECER